jgi:hypothetical protein
MAENVPEKVNVFISHIHEADHRLEPLKELLAKHGCEVRDSSVTNEKPNNAEDPDYIMRDILKPRIDWCSTMIVLVTPDTKDSDWVNREIEYAHDKDKNIVGVWDHGEQGCELPERLDDYGATVVAWRGEQIVDAIFGRIDGWRDPKGDPISPREIRHYCCVKGRVL